MSRNAMIHNNGDILAAVYIQTTGNRPRYNDVVQIGVLLLDSVLKPMKGFVPFYIEMKPRREENINYAEMKIKKPDFWKLMQSAIDPDRAADFFDEWYQKIPLKPGKKLLPVCYGWARIYGFLEDWLGYENVNHHFSHEARDVLSCAMYENDKADAHIEQVPYPKHEGLSNICYRHNIDNRRVVDPLLNCSDLAALYKRMLVSGQFTPIGSYVETEEE